MTCFSMSRKERLTGSLGEIVPALTVTTEQEQAAARRFCARAHLAGRLTLEQLRDVLDELGLN